MPVRNIISLAFVLVAHVSALYASDNELPWNAVFADVSCDLAAHDKAGRSELQLLTSVIDELSSNVNDEYSVTAFAEERAVVPIESLLDDIKKNYDSLSSRVGNSTRIYDTMLSAVSAAKHPQRLLVITNGMDTGSSFHPRTAAKILRSKGIVVDGVCVYLPADSMAVDSVYSPKPLLNNDFHDFVISTGGKFISIKDTQAARSALRLLLENAKSETITLTGFNHGYDEAILNKVLQRAVSRKRLEVLP